MIYELRKKPGSDMAIKEFFAKLGLEEFWTFIRTNILGDPKMFVFVLIISIIVFLIGYKCDSISLQVLSIIVFFGLLVFQILLI